MTQEINPETLRRYIEIRRIVRQDINTLYALTSIMAMFQEVSEDKVTIDPFAVGLVNEIMLNAVLNISEKLDDFMPLDSAELALDKLKNQSPDDVEQP